MYGPESPGCREQVPALSVSARFELERWAAWMRQLTEAAQEPRRRCHVAADHPTASSRLGPRAREERAAGERAALQSLVGGDEDQTEEQIAGWRDQEAEGAEGGHLLGRDDGDPVGEQLG